MLAWILIRCFTENNQVGNFNSIFWFVRKVSRECVYVRRLFHNEMQLCFLLLLFFFFFFCLLQQLLCQASWKVGEQLTEEEIAFDHLSCGRDKTTNLLLQWQPPTSTTPPTTSTTASTASQVLECTMAPFYARFPLLFFFIVPHLVHTCIVYHFLSWLNLPHFISLD